MQKYLSTLLLSILLIPVCLDSWSQNLAGQTGQLKAGISKIDITPDFPVKLYGYASRTSLSEGVHDPLSARAVVFENNRNKFVLLSSDLGSYGREALDVIRRSLIDRFGLKDSELFLTAIHSHSSPVLTLNKETGDPANIRYTESLNDKLLTLVGEAFNNLTPVRAGVGTGSSPVGSNRREMRPDGSITLGRNPYGPADKEVLVLKIETPGGVPLAGIFDYATHATALGPRNLMISGDVLGISSQFVEKILGDDFVAPVFAGASGNIDPWYRVLPGFDTEPGWIPEPVLLGTLLGEEIVHVFRTINETGSDMDISTSFETIELPARKNNENQNSGEKEQESKVPVNIVAAKLGNDVAFVGISVEMLTELGMLIKSGSPFRHTFVITHCNGASGYLPPAALYKEGGYEITSTPFAIGSGELVVKKALRMLYDLK
jgi:neutral ceramidase